LRIALVDSSPKAKVYPVSLLKIGAWRKAKGDDCVLFVNKLPAHNEFDEIWITTCFTFDIPHAVAMVKEAKRRARRVWVGGIAVSLLPQYFTRQDVGVHQGLIDDAERFAPDYNLLGKPPTYSISHTSRGCIRKCKFCMVPRLEPVFEGRDWVKDIHPQTRKILFYDNNWLAKDVTDLRIDVELLQEMVKSGQIRIIDFNQGLDCRLLTEEKADLLKGLPIKPMRFAFDGIQEDGYYQRAVEMMSTRGFREFMTYVLYNFKDTPKDFYYRLRQSVELAARLRINVDSFPMRYQPILDIDSQREFVGKNWTRRKKRAFQCIKSNHAGPAGTITTHAHNTSRPYKNLSIGMARMPTNLSAFYLIPTYES